MKRFLLSGSLLALILVSCSGTASEPSQYDVVSFDKNGNIEIYSSYPK